MTARLIGLTVFRPEQANRAAEVLEGKFYRDKTGGKLGILFESDISKGLWLAAVVVALAPLVVGRLRACV